MTLFLTEGYLKRQPSQLHAPHIRTYYKVYNDTSQLLKGNKMKTMQIVKAVSAFAVSIGVGAVVGNLIKSTTPGDINTFNKVLVGIGTFATGAVISDLASKQITTQFEELETNVTSIVNDLEEETSEED